MNDKLTVKKQPVDLIVKQYLSGKLSLDDLTPEQLKIIVQAVQIDDLKKDFSRKADLAKINYQEERETFISHAGKTKSIHTKITYNNALTRLEDWARKKGIEVLEMKAKDADDFIYALRSEKSSPSSINIYVAACSSFFSFIERRYDFIRNPFRGTKARPPKKSKTVHVPTDKEINIILDELSGVYKAAATVLYSQGLRVGALESIKIKDRHYTASSKGKEISGLLNEQSIKAIRKAKLNSKQPFQDITTEKVKDHFRYVTKKLFKDGTLSALYTVHDLRHAFAVKEYTENRDIYRLKVLLNHASIQVTETYLRGLKIL